MKKLYIIMAFFIIGFTTGFVAASNEKSKIVSDLMKKKLSIEEVAINRFGETNEACSLNGQKFIELQRYRMNLLDRGIQAAIKSDLDASKKIAEVYNATSEEVLALQQSLEYFKRLKK